MSRPVKRLLLAALMLAVFVGLPGVANARITYTVSQPVVSAEPVAGVPFDVSGVIQPKSVTSSRATVDVKLYKLTDGQWNVIDTCRATLSAAPAGTCRRSPTCRQGPRRAWRGTYR